MNCKFVQHNEFQICKNCGYKIQTKKRVIRKCPKPVKKGLLTKATNFAKAKAEHIISGKKDTPKEKLALQLNVCENCDNLFDDECLICGCIIALKAKMATQKCPLGKWPSHNMSPEIIFRFDGSPANLKNLYKGASIFFIGGGPSMNSIDDSILSQRGILSFAVNNIAAYKNFKPNFWLSADNPTSFHKNLWNDSSICKFVRGMHASTISNDKYINNAYWYETNEDFNVNTFFTEPTVNFGNKKGLEDAYGNSGRRSVMFSAMRIIQYLGFTTVYLLGCDFNMQIEQPYAFPQKKWSGGVDSNNNGYKIIDSRFNKLFPEMQKLNFNVFNCTPNSALTAFPKLSLAEALMYATSRIEKEANLANMYGQTDT